jgi:hypothetical protein
MVPAGQSNDDIVLPGEQQDRRGSLA